ncbi:MAG: cobalt-precorrin 5A hydrolase [Sarcina sp.]
MITVISVNEKGDKIAEKIKKYYSNFSEEVEIISKSKKNDFNLKIDSKKAWECSEVLVFIASTGIAVRAIANLVNHKSKDPAVIVVDVNSLYSISLLSGHLGGANDYANEIANILHAKAIITTATDNLKKEAPDLIAKKNNLIIDDFNGIKLISKRLIDNLEVYFKDDKEKIKLPKEYINTKEFKENLLWITNKEFDENFNRKNSLKLIRKDIVLGIGCRKNIKDEDLIEFVFETLKMKNIDRRAILKIASIDIKKDEKAILNLANVLKVPFVTFSKDDIKKVQDKFIGSDFVEKSVGVRAVCAPTAYLLGGEIILEKYSKKGMTISIGEIK